MYRRAVRNVGYISANAMAHQKARISGADDEHMASEH